MEILKQICKSTV